MQPGGLLLNAKLRHAARHRLQGEKRQYYVGVFEIRDLVTSSRAAAHVEAECTAKQRITTPTHPHKKRFLNRAPRKWAKDKETLCRNHVVYTKNTRTNTVPRAGTPLYSTKDILTTFMMGTCTTPTKIMSTSM